MTKIEIVTEIHRLRGDPPPVGTLYQTYKVAYWKRMLELIQADPNNERDQLDITHQAFTETETFKERMARKWEEHKRRERQIYGT